MYQPKSKQYYSEYFIMEIGIHNKFSFYTTFVSAIMSDKNLTDQEKLDEIQKVHEAHEESYPIELRY